MEKDAHKKSVRMRYMRYKTVSIPNIGSQEDLRAKFKPNFGQTTTATNIRKTTVETQQEKRKSLQLSDSWVQSRESGMEQQQLTTEADELKTKLQQQNVKDSEYQTQMEVLQKDLIAKEATIKDQQSQIAELNNILIKKTDTLEQTAHELLLTKEQLRKKEDQLLQLRNTPGLDDQLKLALSKSDAELKEMSLALEKQSLENTENKKIILNLTRSSQEAENIGKELEKCLSDEIAKTNKGQEELEFVIQTINDEKEELYKSFEEFKAATVAFLAGCNNHRDTVLKAIEERKVNIDK